MSLPLQLVTLMNKLLIKANNGVLIWNEINDMKIHKCIKSNHQITQDNIPEITVISVH